MVIQELIRRLQEFDPDQRVVIHDGEWDDFQDIEDVYIVPATRVSGNQEGDIVVKISCLDREGDR